MLAFNVRPWYNLAHKHGVFTQSGALEEWGPKVRTTRSMEELHADKDYKLIETCPSFEFEPAMEELDRLLDTLVIKRR